MQEKIKKYFAEKFYTLIILNIILIVLFLLRSAGYFAPLFLISVNFIVFSGIILGIFLLELKSKHLFILALFFLAFAGVIKIAFFDIWAERTMIYAYQSLLIGVIMLFVEYLHEKKKK